MTYNFIVAKFPRWFVPGVKAYWRAGSAFCSRSACGGGFNDIVF
jgi:hypothetical protein